MGNSFQTLTTRTLSGKGTVRLPIENRESVRILSIFCDVVRPPSQEYVNYKYQPVKGFYGYLNLLVDDYVLRTFTLEFRKQRFDLVNSVDGFLQRQLACVNQEILQSIANLGAAFGGVPISIQNETKDWASYFSIPDTLQFVIDGGAAVQITVKALEYDECEELDNEPPPSEEPEPPDPPEYEPNEPVTVDPPYSEDDFDEYAPNPIDEIDDGIPDSTGTKQGAVFTIIYLNGQSDTIGPRTFWLPIINVSFSGASVLVQSYGTVQGEFTTQPSPVPVTEQIWNVGLGVASVSYTLVGSPQ